MATSNKKLFRNMQEHPEQYTDQQLENLMQQLDNVPDVDAAWQEFESKLSLDGSAGKSIPWYSSLRKIAAVFLGILLVSVTALAAVRIVQKHEAGTEQPVASAPVQKSSATVVPHVRFENATLDSILVRVAGHYGLSVNYSDEGLKTMKFFITWQPDKEISAFIQKMNMFDGLHLSFKHDTISRLSLYKPEPNLPFRDETQEGNR